MPPRSGRRVVRRICKYPLLFVLLSLVASLGVAAGQTDSSLAQASTRPNIILILADDLDEATSQKKVGLEKHIGNEGVTFENAFVTEPVCCPSRATILTGQYPHNHLVRRNSPPLGGFEIFKRLGREKSTVATWLDRKAGYQTAFVGAKYLNGYAAKKRAYVPPGWDEWYTLTADKTINRNGRIEKYPEGTYQDDLLSKLTRDFVGRQKGKSRPFFVHLSLQAPHDPAQPAKRYEDEFKRARAPRTPAFNERVISDKPGWVRDKSRLSTADKKRIDQHYRDRLRTMAAVGELVGKLVKTLKGSNKLNNTYIVFSSDNGYHQGQHRIELGKGTPYEESIGVPLMVRGPGIPAGIERNEMVLNNDFAPTFADWAGVTAPASVDGRSFASLIDGNPGRLRHRGVRALRFATGKRGPGPAHQATRH